ncbi:uncharacterized protein NPIL_306061 [Nephila pilipes]|uniref:Uncharacterized protein n=1 Tax=Nephila pilipes TaxID=299642 RepID=A0A8X6N2N0_NEPPI|nr:uncharacterized protein NPIL_306061 [Nephila pilipes]
MEQVMPQAEEARSGRKQHQCRAKPLPRVSRRCRRDRHAARAQGSCRTAKAGRARPTFHAARRARPRSHARALSESRQRTGRRRRSEECSASKTGGVADGGKVLYIKFSVQHGRRHVGEERRRGNVHEHEYELLHPVPSSLELLQEMENNVKIVRKDRNISIPSSEMTVITVCLEKISPKLNLCCPKLTKTIVKTLQSKMVTAEKEDLKWCTEYCYEPLILECANPSSMLKLVKLIMEAINSTWHDVTPIAIFPENSGYKFPRDILIGVDLCLKIVANLHNCCEALPLTLEILLEGKPWNQEKFKMKKCKSECYKIETKECPEESRDATLAVIKGLIYYDEIRRKSIACLESVEDDFDKCCNGMIHVIYSTYQNKEACKFPDLIEDNCNISCVRFTLNKCNVVAADMVQRIMKYIFEYKPYCTDKPRIVDTSEEKSSSREVDKIEKNDKFTTAQNNEVFTDSYSAQFLNKIETISNIYVSEVYSTTISTETNYTERANEIYSNKDFPDTDKSSVTYNNELNEMTNRIKKSSEIFSTEVYTGTHSTQLSNAFEPLNSTYVSDDRRKAFVFVVTNDTDKTESINERYNVEDSTITSSTDKYSEEYISEGISEININKFDETNESSDSMSTINSEVYTSTNITQWSNTKERPSFAYVSEDSRNTYSTEVFSEIKASENSNETYSIEVLNIMPVTDKSNTLYKSEKVNVTNEVDKRQGINESTTSLNTEGFTGTDNAQFPSDAETFNTKYVSEDMSRTYVTITSSEQSKMEDFSESCSTEESNITPSSNKFKTQYSFENTNETSSTKELVETHEIIEPKITLKPEVYVGVPNTELSNVFETSNDIERTLRIEVSNEPIDVVALSAEYNLGKSDIIPGSENNGAFYSSKDTSGIIDLNEMQEIKKTDGALKTEIYSGKYNTELSNTFDDASTYISDDTSRMYGTVLINVTNAVENLNETFSIEGLNIFSPKFDKSDLADVTSETSISKELGEMVDIDISSGTFSTEIYSDTTSTQLPNIFETVINTYVSEDASKTYGTVVSSEVNASENGNETHITNTRVSNIILDSEKSSEAYSSKEISKTKNSMEINQLNEIKKSSQAFNFEVYSGAYVTQKASTVERNDGTYMSEDINREYNTTILSETNLSNEMDNFEDFVITYGTDTSNKALDSATKFLKFTNEISMSETMNDSHGLELITEIPGLDISNIKWNNGVSKLTDNFVDLTVSHYSDESGETFETEGINETHDNELLKITYGDEKFNIKNGSRQLITKHGFKDPNEMSEETTTAGTSDSYNIQISSKIYRTEKSDIPYAETPKLIFNTEELSRLYKTDETYGSKEISRGYLSQEPSDRHGNEGFDVVYSTQGSIKTYDVDRTNEVSKIQESSDIERFSEIYITEEFNESYSTEKSNEIYTSDDRSRSYSATVANETNAAKSTATTETYGSVEPSETYDSEVSDIIHGDKIFGLKFNTENRTEYHGTSIFGGVSGSNSSNALRKMHGTERSNVKSSSEMYNEVDGSKKNRDIDKYEETSKTNDTTRSILPSSIKKSGKIDVSDQSSGIFVAERSGEKFGFEVSEETYSFEESTQTNGATGSEITNNDVNSPKKYITEVSYGTYEDKGFSENYSIEKSNNSYGFELSGVNGISRGVYSNVGSTSFEHITEMNDIKSSRETTVTESFRGTSGSKEIKETYDNEVTSETYVTKAYGEIFQSEISGGIYDVEESNGTNSSKVDNRTVGKYITNWPSETIHTEGCADYTMEDIDDVKKDTDVIKQKFKKIEKGVEKNVSFTNWTNVFFDETTSSVYKTTTLTDKIEVEISIDKTEIGNGKINVKVNVTSNNFNEKVKTVDETEGDEHDPKINIKIPTVLVDETETDIRETIKGAERIKVGTDVTKVNVDTTLKSFNKMMTVFDETKRNTKKNISWDVRSTVFFDEIETDIREIEANSKQNEEDVDEMKVNTITTIRDLNVTEKLIDEAMRSYGEMEAIDDTMKRNIYKTKHDIYTTIRDANEMATVGLDKTNKEINETEDIEAEKNILKKTKKKFEEIDRNIGTEDSDKLYNISISVEFDTFKKDSEPETHPEKFKNVSLRSENGAARFQNRINENYSLHKKKNIITSPQSDIFGKISADRKENNSKTLSYPSFNHNKINLRDNKTNTKGSSFGDDKIAKAKYSSKLNETETYAAPVNTKNFDGSYQITNLRRTDGMKEIIDEEIAEDYTFDITRDEDTFMKNKSTATYSDNETEDIILNGVVKSIKKIVTKTDEEEASDKFSYEPINASQIMNNSDKKLLREVTASKSGIYFNYSKENINALNNGIGITNGYDITNSEGIGNTWFHNMKNIGTIPPNVKDEESNATESIYLDRRRKFLLNNKNPDIKRNIRAIKVQNKNRKQKNTLKENKTIISSDSFETDAVRKFHIIDNKAYTLTLDGRKVSSGNIVYNLSTNEAERNKKSKFVIDNDRNQNIKRYDYSDNIASEINLDDHRYISSYDSKNRTYKTDDATLSDEKIEDEDGEFYEDSFISNVKTTEPMYILQNLTENVGEKLYRFVKNGDTYNFHIKKAREIDDSYSLDKYRMLREDRTDTVQELRNQDLTERIDSEYSTSRYENIYEKKFKFIQFDESAIDKDSTLKDPIESIVARCAREASPILMECCMPMLGALYAVINEEQLPLDARNLKKCNNFCYKSALQRCANKGTRIVASIIKKIKSYPALGADQFGKICNNTIHIALNDCCKSFVLNIFENTEVKEEKVSNEPGCAKICQKTMFQQCLKFKPLKKHFASVISRYSELQSTQLMSMEEIPAGKTFKSSKVQFQSIEKHVVPSIKLKFQKEQMKKKILKGGEFKEELQDRLQEGKLKSQKPYQGNQYLKLTVKEFTLEKSQDRLKEQVQFKKQYLATISPSQELSLKEFSNGELFLEEPFQEELSLKEMPQRKLFLGEGSEEKLLLDHLPIDKLSLEEQNESELIFGVQSPGDLSLKQSQGQLSLSEKSLEEISVKENKHGQLSFEGYHPSQKAVKVQFKGELQNEFPSIKQLFILDELPSEIQLLSFEEPLIFCTYLLDNRECFFLDIEEVSPFNVELPFLEQFLFFINDHLFLPIENVIIEICVPINANYILSDNEGIFRDANQLFSSSKILSPDERYSFIKDGCIFQLVSVQLYPFEHRVFNAEQSLIHEISPDIQLPVFTESFIDEAILRFKRQSFSGSGTRKRKEVVEEILQITSHYKEKIKQCIYNVQNASLDACLPGIYEYILMLSNGIRSNFTRVENATDVSFCINKVFHLCSADSVLVINSLLHRFLKIPLKVTSTANIRKENVDAPTKHILNMCLARINPESINTCVKNFLPVIREILDEGQSTHNLNVAKEGEKCLGKAFSICSSRARLIIMNLILHHKGILLNIQSESTPRSINIHKLINEEEKKSVYQCIITLNKVEIESCGQELYPFLLELAHGWILISDSKQPGNKECLGHAFRYCSIHSRLVIMDLISFVTDDSIDIPLHAKENVSEHISDEERMIIAPCLSQLPPLTVDACLPGLMYVLKEVYQNRIPDLTLFPKEGVDPICIKEIFIGCSHYHRLLIDQLLRKVPQNSANTAVFDTLYSLHAYTDTHEHTERDKELIKSCFNTINRSYLEWCVPGLYDTLQALVELKFPVTFLALKPIEGSCLQMAFAECPYKARLLIKDLLFDFVDLLIDIPLHGAPQGHSGELGPVTDAIKECISNLNSTGSDSCVFGIVDILHRVFVEKVENPEPIVSPDKEKTTMSCLAHLFDPCDLPVKLYFLKRIADISNLNINFLMDTFLTSSTKSAESGVPVDVAKSNLQALLNALPNALYYQMEHERPNSERLVTNFKND